MTLADKVVVLKDGLVMQAGAPMELYHEPANLFAAGVLGAPSMNFLKVTVDDIGDEWVQVSSSALASVKVPRKGRSFTQGQAATLGVRPQYLVAAEGGQGMLNRKVILNERLGSETVVNLAVLDGTTLIAAIAEDAVLVPGDDVAWTFDPALAHAFPEVD
jgi:multiple sugar transport system ATP-binding protein